MRQRCSIGVRTQAETIERNKNKSKKREISPRKASRKGDAFFLSFYFVHLASANADHSTLPHTGEQQREEKYKIKNVGKKCAELLAEKSFLRLHLRHVASGFMLSRIAHRHRGTRRIFLYIFSTFCFAVFYNIFYVFCFVNGQRKKEKNSPFPFAPAPSSDAIRGNLMSKNFLMIF